MSEPSFPSGVIAQEFLSHAAPETVYAWLIANAGNPAEDRYADSPFSTELLAALLKRNDPIINLGLASVVSEPAVLRELWATKNEAVRLAIAGNQHRNNSLLGAAARFGWAADDELTEILENGNPDFVKLWGLNPRLGFDGLEKAFLKEGIYSGLSDDKWLGIVYWALQNPNLIVPSDEFYEGLDLPAYTAAWSLLVRLPNNRDNAHLICERYSSLNTFLIPRNNSELQEDLAELDREGDDALAKFDKNAETWAQKNDKRNVAFLTQVFGRWSAAASKDESAFDRDGNENYGFQILRQNVASAVANHGTGVSNFIKNHDDVYVRRGYYAAGRFSDTEEVKAAFQKDTRDFLEAAIYNDNLYASYPKGVRTALHDLVEANPRYEDYPVPSFPEIWREQATDLFKKNPSHYPDPNDIYSEEPEKVAAPEREQQAELRRRLDRIEAIVSFCATMLIGGVALWAAWGAESFTTKLVSQDYPDRDFGSIAGTVAFVVTLLVVWRVGNYMIFKRGRSL